MNNWKTAISIAALTITGAMATPAAFAKKIDLGKHGQDEIKNTCNAHGGELLGVSDSGSYGCEYADSDTLILCNKSGSCTGYTSAKTVPQGQKILGIAGLKGKAVVLKSDSGKPKGSAPETKEPTSK